MSLTTTVYQPAETISSPDPSAKAHNRFCVLEGTEAEISAALPPGLAIGFANDSKRVLTYDLGSGWAEDSGVITNKDLATILATVPAVGTVAQPTDYPDGRLVVVGTKWGGNLSNQFATFAALDAVTKTNIAAGAKASVVGIGEYELIGGAWVAQLTRNSNGTLSTNGVALVVQEEYFATTTARDTAYPSGGFLGQICWMPNTNVPLGRSRLRWNGTIWAPPAGELIVSLYGASGNPIYQVTPGVLTLAQGGVGNVIPDYMLPDGITLASFWECSVKNAVSSVAGSIAYVTFGGSVPVDTSGGASFNGFSVTPTANGAGITDGRKNEQRVGASFKGMWFFVPGIYFNNTTYRATTTGSFATGVTKPYFMVKASHVSDQFALYSFEVYATGNL